MKNKLILSIIAIILIQIYLANALTIASVSISPQQIAPGGNAKISLEIKNNLEEDLTNVEISLDLKDLPFAPYQSSSETTFDEIREDRSKTAEFEVVALSNAESGTYKIPVKLSYKDSEGEKVEKTSYISLIINSKPDLQIDYEGNLIKGKNNELTIKIVNSGLSSVKLLSLEVSGISGLKILSSKAVYIGEIDSDDFDSAEFKVFVSENSASFIGLPVKLSYKDALNNNYEENKNLQLRTYTTEEAVKLELITKSNTFTIIIAVVVLIILYLIYRLIRKRLRRKKESQE